MSELKMPQSNFLYLSLSVLIIGLELQKINFRIFLLLYHYDADGVFVDDCVLLLVFHNCDDDDDHVVVYLFDLYDVLMIFLLNLI